VSELTYLRALLLGILQGVTEFLPVSSSGHLAIAQRYLTLDPDSQSMLLFDVTTHLGTVVAVLFVFAGRIREYCRRLGDESALPSANRYARHIALMGLVALVPTVGIGLGGKPTLEAAFGKPIWIGTGLIVTGVLLAATLLCRRGRRGWKRFYWWQAFLVGIAQGIAIWPGISRSGATICVATFLGLRRQWAAEFSFFIAVPAIVGATLLKITDTLTLGTEAGGTTPWGPIVVGGVASFVVGVLALKLLLDVVRRARLHYFAVYCWILGGLTIAGVL
jgi:undecaprenyl-diphosphatase